MFIKEINPTNSPNVNISKRAEMVSITYMNANFWSQNPKSITKSDITISTTSNNRKSAYPNLIIHFWVWQHRQIKFVPSSLLFW